MDRQCRRCALADWHAPYSQLSSFSNCRRNSLSCRHEFNENLIICFKPNIDRPQGQAQKIIGVALYTTLAHVFPSQALSSSYVPSPYHPGWEVWAGAVAGIIPFLIGSWEFSKRILIQRRCRKCEGSGLVKRGDKLRKCSECGGFFPWQGWDKFFTATATPGNGGVLRAPRGQTSIFYRVPDARDASEPGAVDRPSEDLQNCENE